MGRTINRPITSVNTPSKSDVQNYFFTHANWKGLNNDKNFLTVDQETFSECKNVYMDSEGLLRSRPSMKIKTVVATINGTETVLSNIVYCEKFANVTVYKVKYNNDYYLIFSPDSGNAIQVSCNENIKLQLVENKIFVFSDTGLDYYDVERGEYLKGDKYIYIPVTKVSEGGVVRDLEPTNELTNSYIHRYLFSDSTGGVDYKQLIGKYVSIKIDGKTYYIDFVEDNETVFLEKEKVLTSSNFIRIDKVRHPLVEISETGSYLLSYSEQVSLSDKNEYDIFYTVDGLIFKELPKINNVIGFPKISKDGNYACCLKSDDLYVISLVNTEVDYFTQWTPLIQTKNKEFYDGELKKFGYIPWFNMDSIPEMHSINNFAIYFSWATSYNFRNRGMLICDDDEYSYSFLARNVEFSKRSGTVYDYVDLHTLEKIDGIIQLDNSYVDFYDTEDEANRVSFNRFRLEFTNVELEKTWEEDGVDKSYYTLSASLLGKLVKPDGTYVTKFEEDTTLHFELSKEYWGGYEDSDTYMAYLDGKNFTCTFRLYAEWGHANFGAKLAISSISRNNSEYINLPFTGIAPFDFEWDSEDGYFGDNLYSCTANIHGKITQERVEYLIDANHVYSCNISSNSNKTLLRTITSDKYVMDNGLCILDDCIKFTKYTGYDVRLYTYTTDYLKYDDLLLEAPGSKCVIDGLGRVFTTEYLYVNANKYIHYLFPAYPIAYTNYFYAHDFDAIYSNDIDTIFTVDEIVRGRTNYFVPELISEIGSFYMSKGKTLYISSYPSDGDFKWYFPKISTETFDEKINDLHPISSTEMAVFLSDSIYNISRSDSLTETGINIYLYYKSKIQVGCAEGSDVITSFDGQYVIFPSNRGLVALTYQELTASTEQVLNFLSDSIHKTFSEYNDSAIKLYKYDYWIACYKENSKALLLFDIRNNSWWPIELCDAIKDIVTVDNKPLILGTNLYYLDSSENDYYDFDGSKLQIDWTLKSQKLHLSAPNNYKHITNITITSVLDNASKEALDLDLIVTNYRKRMNTSEAENFAFNVDTVRVYVKRLNYSKVNEFQYELKCDEYNDIRIPLSLSNISVKYKISGQVR